MLSRSLKSLRAIIYEVYLILSKLTSLVTSFGHLRVTKSDSVYRRLKVVTINELRLHLA